MQVAHAIFAAPKMPNLRASALLAGLGGFKACQTRLTKDAILVLYLGKAGQRVLGSGKKEKKGRMGREGAA